MSCPMTVACKHSTIPGRVVAGHFRVVRGRDTPGREGTFHGQEEEDLIGSCADLDPILSPNDRNQLFTYWLQMVECLQRLLGTYGLPSPATMLFWAPRDWLVSEYLSTQIPDGLVVWLWIKQLYVCILLQKQISVIAIILLHLKSCLINPVFCLPLFARGGKLYLALLISTFPMGKMG